MILFKYTPNQQFLTMLMSNISNHNKLYFDGILDEAYQNIIVGGQSVKKLKIFLVCESNPQINKYTNPLAVVAFNESEAVGFYTEWMNKYGTVICVLEHDASKAKVDPPDV